MFGSERAGALPAAVATATRGPGTEELREILACPDCRSCLALRDSTYRCLPCSKNYPIVDGIPRFVPDEGYTTSFGYQWTRHARTQLDTPELRRSEEAFPLKTGFTREEIRGKLGLDVGCGSGRYAEVASRWGARVIACDASRAVEAAHQNLGRRRNVSVLQADLSRFPFAPESFDFIYSIGVLHHTPDCEAAFRGLVPLLKPGGRIAIWVYSGYNRWYRTSDVYRRVTTRMPLRLLYALCHLAVPLYYVDLALSKLPLLRWVASGSRYVFPFSRDPDWRYRVLDTFDWYSPRYQSKHTYEEVFRWFESAGLVNNRVVGDPIAVQGQKPMPGFLPTEVPAEAVSTCGHWKADD